LSEAQGANLVNQGMTLRDYFAAKAMQVFLQGLGTNAVAEHGARVAEAAFEAADAMLAARESK